jgi:hypothetical protein
MSRTMDSRPDRDGSGELARPPGATELRPVRCSARDNGAVR